MISHKNYNPDVLNCLSNLSSDEVFTPPNLVNEMLDLLPKEIWSDRSFKVLDPSCKSGVFLREASKRFNEGLKSYIEDDQERIEHILGNQIFGIAISKLTAMVSRRTVYCSKNANSKFSISKKFSNNDGNIYYKKENHQFKNGKCEFCKAPEKI